MQEPWACVRRARPGFPRGSHSRWCAAYFPIRITMCPARYTILCCLACTGPVPALGVPPHRALFDAAKAETAGNADWCVDADVHNLGTGTGGVMTVGAGSESNPQRYPTPAQAGITASTPETYWSGALSAWGVAHAQR